MIFCIEAILMVFFWKIEVYSPENLAPPILGPFWSKFGPFWVQRIFKTCLWLGTWSEYSNCIHFLIALWNSFKMTLLLVFKCENKCENLCKQNQKRWRSAQLNSGWRLWSKIDVGKSMVLFLSIPKRWKCENLINKARNSE